MWCYCLPYVYYVPVPENMESSEKVKVDKKEEKKQDKPKTGYRIRMGKWEEVYDEVDGKKTWYNTVTEKTTKKDPFV